MHKKIENLNPVIKPKSNTCYIWFSPTNLSSTLLCTMSEMIHYYFLCFRIIFNNSLFLSMSNLILYQYTFHGDVNLFFHIHVDG